MNEFTNKSKYPRVPEFQPASLATMTHDNITNQSQANEIHTEENHSQNQGEQI